MPDISFDNSDVSANLLDYATPTGFRNGTVFRYELLTGTTITNLVDGTEYFLRRVSSTTMSIHLTEAEAISDTSSIAIVDGGAGTFRLTQVGVGISAAMWAHWHDGYVGDGTGGAGLTFQSNGNAGFTSKATPGSVNDVVTDGVNDTPNLTNESRPATFYQFGYIKAESITPSGEAISALRHVQDWSLCTGWTVGNSIVIPHPFGVAFDEYNGQIFVRDPAVPNKLYNVTGIEYYLGTSADYFGQRLNGIDGDLYNCYLQIGSFGATAPRYMKDDGTFEVISTSWEYEVILIKPNLITTTFDMVNRVYEIADGVDVTYNFPDANSIVGEITIKRRGSGAGKVLFTAQSGQTIDGNVPGTYELEYTVKDVLTVFSYAGNWEIKIYSLV
jgi:hypothetical protein